MHSPIPAQDAVRPSNITEVMRRASPLSRPQKP